MNHTKYNAPPRIHHSVTFTFNYLVELALAHAYPGGDPPTERMILTCFDDCGEEILDGREDLEFSIEWEAEL